MKKLTSLVALFLMCFGMVASAQTIESIGQNIIDPAAQLTEGSYVIFRNVSTDQYVYVDAADPYAVKMGNKPGLNSGTQFIWQVHKSGGNYFFTSMNHRFFPRPKALKETKHGQNNAGTNGAYKGLFDLSKHTTTAFWKLHQSWVENKKINHDKYWSVDGECFAGIDVSKKDDVSTQYEIIPVTVNKTPEQLAVEDLVKPWEALVGYVGAYEKKTIDAAFKCATAAEAQAVFDAATKVVFDASNYYQLVNVKSGEALTVVDGALSTVALDMADDFTMVWKMNPGTAVGSHNLKNANYALYAQTPGVKTLAGEAVDFTMADQGKAEWTLTAGGKNLAQTTEGVVAAEAAQVESHWYLAPVSQVKVQMHPTAEEAPGADVERWATICLPYNAYCMNADLKYYAIGSVSSTTATLVPATGVHLNTGIILQSTGVKDFYQLKIGKLAEGKTEVPAVNLLKGTNVAQPKTATSLVLGKGAQGVGLYAPLAENLKANKAYLETAAGVNGLKFVFDEVTGVEGVEVAAPADNVYYDLSGRRVAQPVKGLYIVNGKKVYVK